MALSLAGPAWSAAPDPPFDADPLPDTGSGITRDVGAIAVIEHDGSNYDSNDIGVDDGGETLSRRAAVTLRFYQDHGDFYDFLVIFTDFEFATPGASAFYNQIRNDVAGIGLPVFDNGPLVGSAGRLQGVIDMAAIDRRRVAPYGLEPGTPAFNASLGILAHELGHRWLSYVDFVDSGGSPSGDLRGRHDNHWSALLDSDASHMYGSEWTPNGDGTFTATRVRDGYSDLDLYLMGMLSADEVDPFVLLRSPGFDATQLPEEGQRVAATPETIALDQVIAAEGPRGPGHLLSPKTFRVGFILLTAPGTDVSAEDLEAVDRLRRALPAYFFGLTHGRAIVDTTLAETPRGPLAEAPDLDAALAWLGAAQQSDGRWEDAPETAIRDTTAALDALRASGFAAGAEFDRGRLWLGGVTPGNVDFLARRVLSLAEPGATGPDLLASLLAEQNEDGGFGASRGFASDPFDTALALRALARLGHAGPAVDAALASLAAQVLADGQWPMVANGEASTIATAQVLLALHEWSGRGDAAELFASGLAGLLTRRNPDGGFGESPSSAYATALGLQTLVRAGVSADLVDGAISWLNGAQLADGSWNGSAFETALVLGALKDGAAPNLVIPADGLVLTPDRAEEGVTVRVTASVLNTGRQPAAPTVARLYDGDPALGELIQEVPVPGLGPLASAPVAFEYATLDRPGTRTLFVVADAAGTVREAREDDNATSRSLNVAGLLPDLEVAAEAFAASPSPAEEGETVAIEVVVRNAGERLAAPSTLRLFDGDPAAGGAPIGEAAVPALDPGGSAVLGFEWDTTGALGAHTLVALADAGFAVDEGGREANNRATLGLEVVDAVPPGVDLAWASLIADPPALETLPQDLQVRGSLRNLAADAATVDVALYDGDPAAGVLLARLSVDVAGRSASLVSFDAQLAAGGTRTLFAVADPDALVTERDEANNVATVVLRDPQDSLDIEVPQSGVAPSTSEPVVGQLLEVAVAVSNRGTAPVTDVPVVLSRDDGAELDRRLVSLAPGASTAISLEWRVAAEPGPLTLRVVADPFDLLVERDESNNAVDVPLVLTASDRPNLAVSGSAISITPDPPLEGADASVEVLVRNQGAVAAAGFDVRFWAGDPSAGGVLIGETTLAGLAGLEAATASVTWSPVDLGSAVGLFVVVDPDDAVAEFDETDNRAFRPLGALALPDLVLASADVSLAPAFPRAGEAVEVRALIRNLGGQPSVATLLEAVERRGAASAPLGSSAVPALAPGESASVVIAWTPLDPPGERDLVLGLDPEDLVVEGDEGNNRLERRVLVQDADLFLSHPYFSPDGDGVQDDTTLGYRATGAVSVVVSDSRGRVRRTLAEAGPAEGSLVWDGRDDRGRLVSDGRYSLHLLGEGDARLGRIDAVLDTNRSTLHDAAGSGLFAVGNLTCGLETGRLDGPVWYPGEDAAIFRRDPYFSGVAVPAGLLRIGIDGRQEVLFEDPWYQGTSPLEVSPDGRELLIERYGELHAVDLTTGARRLLGQSRWAAWSPDGRLVAAQGAVYRRSDGGVQLALPDLEGEWFWSPGGQELGLVDRETSSPVLHITDLAGTLRELPLELQGGDGDDLYVCDAQGTWNGDGRIAIWLGTEVSGSETQLCLPAVFLLADPAAGSARALPWLEVEPPGFGGPVAFAAAGVASSLLDIEPVSGFFDSWDGFWSWSTDGSRVLFTPDFEVTDVASEDGSGRFPLLSAPLHLSRRGGAGHFDGSACPESPTYKDVYGVATLQNLAAQLDAVRLPANEGVLLEGTAADLNLARIQLEYAPTSSPESWAPLGAPLDHPVLGDTLGVFVPPAPGDYLVRLRVEDLAGNVRTVTRVVAWDRRASLANVSQSQSLISPDGDGNRDTLRVDYLVQEPVLVRVVISGPERSDGQPAGVARVIELEHSELGPAGFEWDGRDAGGRRVRDGRYTVSVNGLPLEVEVDTTPPDVGFSYGPVAARVVEGDEGEETVAITAERSWHVLDPNLRSWSGPDGLSGRAPVFVPEVDSDGRPVLDADQRSVPARRDGRGLDRVEVEDEGRIEALTLEPGPFQFEAEDLAGNRSVIAVPPPAESLILRGATSTLTGDPLLGAPLEDKTYLLTPRVEFQLVETLRGTPSSGELVRFEYRRDEGQPWTSAGERSVGGARTWNGAWKGNLLGAGLPLDGALVGRFATDAAGGAQSDEFGFAFCRSFFRIDREVAIVATPQPGRASVYSVRASALPEEPLISAEATVVGVGGLAGFRTRTDLEIIPEAGGKFLLNGYYTAPPTTCDADPGQLVVSVTAVGESGTRYEEDGFCQQLRLVHPQCPGAELSLRQLPQACGEASPDRLLIEARARTSEGATAILERGPVGAPVTLAGFDVSAGSDGREVLVDVTGLPEGPFEIRGRLEDGGRTLAATTTTAIVDRTPPVVDVLAPVEGGELCAEGPPGSEVALLELEIDDLGPAVTLEGVDLRVGTGAWTPLPVAALRCAGGSCESEEDFGGYPQFRSGGASIELPVVGLESSDLAVRLTFCDSSGLKAALERSFSVFRDVPRLREREISGHVFSPNADELLDEVAFDVESFQSLTVDVTLHPWVDGAIGPAVRKLVAQQVLPGGLHSFTWDGRDDGGAVAADGRYVFRVTGTSPCGSSATVRSRAVALDTTPPEVAVTAPADGASVGASLVVLGSVSDTNPDHWALEWGEGTDPLEWFPVEPGASGIEGSLGAWEVPAGRLGAHTLRVVAEDLGRTRTEVRVLVDVVERPLVESFAARPAVFSPNGDEVSDQATLEYTLADAAVVSLEVLDAAAEVVRTLVAGETLAAGSYATVWDGRRDDATEAPDATYSARLRAQDAGGGAAFQEETIPLAVDRGAPVLEIDQPVLEGCLTSDDFVEGRVTDPHLTSFGLFATPFGGQPRELVSGSVSAPGPELVALSPLGEGGHVLTGIAEDEAGNRSETAVTFTVDSLAPEVAFRSPAEGQVLARGAAPVEVRGFLVDANLTEYALGFGPGSDPAFFVEIARAPSAGGEVLLGAWDVSALSDGPYTLRLEAWDCSGTRSEARVAVVLDGEPPGVAIDAPEEDGVFGPQQPVVGSVGDLHLEEWRLETAPGDRASAFQWSAVASGAAGGDGIVLAEAVPYLADGAHTFRLTARDAGGLEGEVLRTVTVDTVPPDAASALAAEVVASGEGEGLVRLTWSPSGSPDVAGYLVRVDGVAASPEPLAATAFEDAGRVEGTYLYSVVAVDRAGNEAEPATLEVRVDVTPPLVDLLSPDEGQALSGSVDVRGTATAPDDFAEYRLFVVDPGTAPVLVQRSTVAVAAGRLGTWVAVGSGLRELRLEADDTTGNTATASVTVEIDNDAPDAPVLVSTAVAPDVDSVTVTWQESLADDVRGYLVYRNGRIANAPGLVVGDRGAFAVPAPSYVDAALPDGEHCYRVAALDEAGNLSAFSDESCETLENRAPHAVLVSPVAGLVFDYPLAVVARVEDRDVASVAFELRPEGDPAWTPLALDTAEPFETLLESEGLAGGRYEIRAVAEDAGGRVDPAPPTVVVERGDATAPAPPAGLVAAVDGTSVSLSWSPGGEPDLAGYHVERDGLRLTPAPLAGTTFDTTVSQPDRVEYAVIAVDASGNESEAARVAVLVYAVTLDFRFPVVQGPLATLSGAGARPGFDVEIAGASGPLVTVPATDDRFVVEDVPLAPGENRLRATGVDPQGNRSIPSAELLLVSNTPPPPVTGLAAAVDGRTVDLSWDAQVDPETVGYRVSRGGAPLTGTVPQTEASSVAASSTYGGLPASDPPGAAFDGDDTTRWIPAGYPSTWTVEFAEPVLVDTVELRFRNFYVPVPIADYRIEAAWQGGFVTLVSVRNNGERTVRHTLPSAFSTTALRVSLDRSRFGLVGLGEVVVERPDLVTGTTFQDEGDGTFQYAVSAVDRYGAAGPAAELEVSAGDAFPPDPPAGLAGEWLLGDVLLSWAASPDAASYRVLRDGVEILETGATAATDPSPPPGTYSYAVVALDAVGNASAPSDPVLVEVPEPGAPPLEAPVILAPTTAGTPFTTAALRVDVSGTAPAGTTVSLDVNGRLRGTAVTVSEEGLSEVGSIPLPPGQEPAVVSPDGRHVAHLVEGAGGPELHLLSPASGDEVLSAPGFATFAEDALDPGAFSRDSRWLAYAAVNVDAGGEVTDSGVFRLEVGAGAPQLVASGPGLRFAAVPSPDGGAVAFAEDLNGAGAVRVVDAAGTERAVVSASLPAFLTWSPDGALVAYAEYDSETDETGHVRVLDVAAGTASDLGVACVGDRLEWSPDMSLLACPVEGPAAWQMTVFDLATGRALVRGEDALFPSFAPDGRRLAFSTVVEVAEDVFLHRVHVWGFDPGAGVVDLVEARDVERPARFLDDGRLGVVLADRVAIYDAGGGTFLMEDLAVDPGENAVVARATDLATEVTSDDSAPISILVEDPAAPDVSVAAADVFAHPALPLVGQPAVVAVRVRNLGTAAAVEVEVGLSLIGPSGAAATQVARLGRIEPGASALVTAPWTPAAAGTLLASVEAVLTGGEPELRADNNRVSVGLFVGESAGLSLTAATDRAEYAPGSVARLGIGLQNAGADFTGQVETRLHDAAGRLVAAVDTRPLDLSYGASTAFNVQWPTGTTLAGDYALVVRARDASGFVVAEASAPLRILSDRDAALRLTPERTSWPAGAAAGFAARVENLGRNTALEGYRAQLWVTPAGGGPETLAAERLLPVLLPGGLWTDGLTWSPSGGAGDYLAELRLVRVPEAPLAAAAAAFELTTGEAPLAGTLSLQPADTLAGELAEARLTVTNPGADPLVGLPVAVEVIDGSTGLVLATASDSLDLGPGGTAERTVSLPTGSVVPGLYPVRLRAGTPAATLARARLAVHGALSDPSVDSPADGAEVDTSHPVLCVNNATSPEGAPLTYAFELYGDAALTQNLPGIAGVAGAEPRTCWRVALKLGEDRRFWWRARATDGFSSSGWTEVASLFVNETDLPPQAPVPDAPEPDARVATFQPELLVTNAVDPEGAILSYEFRVATDAAMAQIVTSAAGVAEGDVRTAWTVPVPLDENATYWWTARADDGPNLSPWSAPVAFTVDTADDPPTAPVLLRPADGGEVATLTPELAVGNATDPDSADLVYVFEIDAAAGFDSPALQASPEIASGATETAWTPAALADDTLHYWRAAARDATSQGPWVEGSFFVNLANDPPSAPVPLAPADAQIVTTATPALRVRNAVDPDRDALVYAFEVYDAAGALVAATSGVPETAVETGWTVDVPLAENGTFEWRARATDADVDGPWSALLSFRVNAVDDPPTAPVPTAPSEGAVIDVPSVTLAVQNATSPDALPLSYGFELYSEARDGTLTLLESASGLPEGSGQTTWTPAFVFVDGEYSWRARAVDPIQPGPWSSSAHFTVALDVPPAPPAGLQAVPGDTAVSLTWTASAEADVSGYRVYRSLASGGPYTLVAEPTAPEHEDTGLENGVTAYYVVTAVDARFESGFSAEVAATPFDPTPRFSGSVAVLPGEVLAGDEFEVRSVVSNDGMVDLVALPVRVEIAGVEAAAFGVDLAPGESDERGLPFSSDGLGFGLVPVRLLAGDPAEILGETALRVHAPITAPSADAPAPGARVGTDRPPLTVNDGASPEGAALTYDFQVFADAGLGALVAETTDVPETPDRTSWTVPVSLDENATYYWRARAGDGFSTSDWTAAASFQVDVVPEAPTAPVLDAPEDGARVGTRQPILGARNATDPEGDALSYAFEVATDPAMAGVVSSVAGLPEMPGVTTWRVPAPLGEDVIHYWRARAHDGTAFSEWSEVRSFTVDSFDGAPSAPVPLDPVDDVEVATLSPTLVAGNAVDPEGRTLVYRFEVDASPAFDSPERQASGPVAEGPGETAWTPPLPLRDNAHHYWRVSADDGNSAGPWASARCFANLANDLPGAPVPVSPADGTSVGTPTPELRVANAPDLDGDALLYEFAVTDAAGDVVASVLGVPETPDETAWTVSVALAENAVYSWRSRARDDDGPGPWSAARAFRVNAVDDPPTAPEPLSPPEGAVLDAPAVTLVVANATSPDDRSLDYAFELYAEDGAGNPTLVAATAGVPEEDGSTGWSPGVDLPDGGYAWRARANDGLQDGPWSPTARFTVAVDVPPAAPAGLEAAAGDATVVLSWPESPEPDVASYRVYRGTGAGGPYAFVAEVAEPGYTDADVVNGTTVYYVVTALDARFESGFSPEAAATPGTAPDEVRVKLRFKPDKVPGECLIDRGLGDHRHDHGKGKKDEGRKSKSHGHSKGRGYDDVWRGHGKQRRHAPKCPEWLEARIDLPKEIRPDEVSLDSIRLEGQVAPDLDDRHASRGHGKHHLEVRFRFASVAPLLEPGKNELELTARAGAFELRGADVVKVEPLKVDLQILPPVLSSKDSPHGKSKGSKKHHGSKGHHAGAVVAALTFRPGVDASAVDVSAVRLNESLAPRQRLLAEGRLLVLAFDWDEVLAVLPSGSKVEVRVSGELGGLEFEAETRVRVEHDRGRRGGRK